MRERSDFRRLRAGVILLGVVLLSLHWSIREDPCARQPALEIAVVNELGVAAEVTLVVTDSAGQAVFQASYHLEAGAQTSTGPIEVPPGSYRATATVEGDGSGSETLGVGPCGGQARVSVTPDRVTIVRSEGP